MQLCPYLQRPAKSQRAGRLYARMLMLVSELRICLYLRGERVQEVFVWRACSRGGFILSHCAAPVECSCCLCSQDSLWSACCERLYSTSSRYQALRTQCLKGLQVWLGVASMKETHRVRAYGLLHRPSWLSVVSAVRCEEPRLLRAGHDGPELLARGDMARDNLWRPRPAAVCAPPLNDVRAFVAKVCLT